MQKLAEKFKELKSLVYEYKDKKESEINQLNNELMNFKNEIDENKVGYEKILDHATEEIENFLKKANIDKPLQ